MSQPLRQPTEDSEDTKKRVSLETFTSGEINPIPLSESCVPLDQRKLKP